MRQDLERELVTSRQETQDARREVQRLNDEVQKLKDDAELFKQTIRTMNLTSTQMGEKLASSQSTPTNPSEAVATAVAEERQKQEKRILELKTAYEQENAKLKKQVAELAEKASKKDLDDRINDRKITVLKKEIAELKVRTPGSYNNKGEYPAHDSSFKYLVVSDNLRLVDLLNIENTEYLSADSLDKFKDSSVSLYQKELIVVLGAFSLCRTTSLYAQLERFYQRWKSLRPDAEIHVMGWQPQSILTVIPNRSTLFNSFHDVFMSGNNYMELVPKMRLHWPIFAVWILNEEAKKIAA